MKKIKNKVYLIAGIVMLMVGVILKIIEAPRYVSMLFFISGGGFKSVYLINGFRSGTLAGLFYLGLLLLGLLLLFLSIVLRKDPIWSLQADILLFTAISIKIFSIVGMKRTANIKNAALRIKNTQGSHANGTNCSQDQ